MRARTVVGDAAEIRARAVRKQKTDSRDALPILDLLLTDRLPRIWIPAVAERDARQLLRHRGKLVRFRTSVQNQLHALAMGEGVCRRKKLWTKVGRKELEGLSWGPWRSRRREDLLGMLDRLNARIEELDPAVKNEAASRPEAVRRMQQPGVGPVTALAFVLTIGPVARFRKSKPVVSYLGLNPRESSGGGKQRLGSISKQGNSMLRWLLNEAAQTASKFDPELRRDYLRLQFRRGRGVAQIAIARKLAVRLYWMLRQAGAQPAPPAHMQGSPTRALVPARRDRGNDGAPRLPCKQGGSSDEESWSEVEDRIDGWWQLVHRKIRGNELWSQAATEFLPIGRSPTKSAGLCPSMIVASRPPRQGSR